MRRLDLSGRAGGTGGYRNTAEIEANHRRFGLQAGNREQGGIRQPRGAFRKHNHSNGLPKPVLEAVAKGLQPGCIAFQPGNGRPNGRAKGRNPRDILGAAPPVALLRAALLLGEDVGAAPEVERADALRALELVGAQGEHVDPERVDVDVEVRRRLDGIDGEQDAAVGVHPAADLGDRLDRADLVVREHDRDEDRLVGDGGIDMVGVDPAVAIDRQLDDLEPELLEVAQGVTDGVVLDRGRDNPVAAPLARPGSAFQPEVEGFGAARGQDDLAALGAEPPGDGLVRLVERRPRPAPEAVTGRRVAEVVGQEREHRVEDLAPERGRRRVVEVDRMGADRGRRRRLPGRRPGAAPDGAPAGVRSARPSVRDATDTRPQPVGPTDCRRSKARPSTLCSQPRRNPMTSQTMTPDLTDPADETIQSADMEWIESPVDDETYDLVTVDGARRARFTLNRDTATSRDDVDLMGLDHPLIQEELGRWRSVPPEELGIAVAGDVEEAVLLSFWMVEASAGNGERRVVVQPIAVKQDGTRVPAVERQCERYLQAPTTTPKFSPEQRLELFSRAVEPTLQRELKHKGAANGDGSYSAELIGYVEIVP